MGKTTGVRGVRAAARSRAGRAGIALALTGLMVPLTVAMGTPAAAASSCSATTGPHQKQVEKFLGLKADGKQSSADCRAIRAFQKKHGITPAVGYAGPLTWQTMNLMIQQRAAGKNPNKAGKCPVNKGRIACVDLTRQLSWIQDGKKLAFGPVPVRTGKKSTPTRTGAKKIEWRNIDHYSSIYKVPMPYAQFFDGGQAFHSVTKSMWNPPGSGGCVNMRPDDAKKYWKMLKNGDDVYVYGRKPGT